MGIHLIQVLNCERIAFELSHLIRLLVLLRTVEVALPQ